jgi:hypothetical protein
MDLLAIHLQFLVDLIICFLSAILICFATIYNPARYIWSSLLICRLLNCFVDTPFNPRIQQVGSLILIESGVSIAEIGFLLVGLFF